MVIGTPTSGNGERTTGFNGSAVVYLQTPAIMVADRSITALEGLPWNGGPSLLQQVFIDEQAAQCGNRLPGMIILAQELLDANRSPTEPEVCAALNENLCRCGSRNRIVRPLPRAAKGMRSLNYVLEMSRRTVLRTGGALTMAFDLPTTVFAQDGPKLLREPEDGPNLASRIAVHAGNRATLLIGKVEAGQGTFTAATQCAEDEPQIDGAILDVVSR